MRGLIEKDLRLTLTRKQTLLIFFVMALIMGVSMDGAFIVGYLTILATIVAVGTISYDEFDNGFTFLMTLPFDRKTYIREKYLFCFLMAAAAWCVGTVLCFIGNIVRRSGVSMIDELPMLAALLPVLYLSAAVMIPLQLKYGSEKSKTVLFLLFGAIAVLLFWAKNIFSGTNNPFMQLAKTLDGMSPSVVLLTLTGVCALAAYASYLWSTWIMEKKEF